MRRILAALAAFLVVVSGALAGPSAAATDTPPPSSAATFNACSQYTRNNTLHPYYERHCRTLATGIRQYRAVATCWPNVTVRGPWVYKGTISRAKCFLTNVVRGGIEFRR